MRGRPPHQSRIAQCILVSAVVAVFTATTGAANASEQFYVYGVADDQIRNHRTGEAERAGRRIANAGFNLVRSTVPWVQGQKHLNHRDTAALRNLVRVAESQGLTVMLTVFPYHDRELNPRMPIRPSDQRIFADFVEYLAKEFPGVKYWEIGNEPNWSFFWSPQFDPSGRDAAIRPYFNLLAKAYDKLKARNTENIVIGGAFASVGEDDPYAARKRHSPTRSIQLLGQYYRESGRTRPIMDWLSIHPYPEYAGEPPDRPHPSTTTIGFADYKKLVKLLGEAFDGTAQRGRDLPVLWSEYGVDSEIPSGKASLYKGEEKSKPVLEDVQAVYYRQALELVACQSTAVGVIFFQAMDEKSLGRWQSGLYYPDGSAKASHEVVKEAIKKAKSGGIRC